MTNTNNTPQQDNELSIDVLRQLAFMQHEGESFFIVNGKAYEGDKDDIKSDYDASEENETISFSDYCAANCSEVADFDNDDYLVLTDEEADEKWEESLDSYIEDYIQPGIDKIAEGQGNLQYYIKFDEEMWKRDARMDGRGHSLSSYDGCENEETVNDTTFYIYRLN